MGDYKMLADGDHVLVAVSGGIDSLVLAAVLNSWRHKAPIDYSVRAIYLDMGFAPADAALVTNQLNRLGIPLLTEKLTIPEVRKKQENCCYVCARKRRNKLFDIAREKNFSKLAMGHHKDDIIETFFINLMYSGNLSTMVPSQQLFDGKLTVIRPLACLEKNQIIDLGQQLKLRAVTSCPLAGNSKRKAIRKLLDNIYGQDKKIKASIFAALGNVRREYLL